MALHKIKAQLYDNVLTDNPNDFAARVVSEKSLTVANIAKSAAMRGGADVSSSAMEHAVNLWLKEMAYRLCDGFSVNTGYFYAAPHIKGVFDDPNENFNPDKHTIGFDFSQGALMRKELGAVEVQITGVADVGCFIGQVTDVKTGSVNDLLTPNRNLRISGAKIKVAGDNPDVGVYFVVVDAAGAQPGDRVKVDTSDIVTNNPSEVIIVIPALATGTYRVEVVTQYSTGSGKPLKEPRTAALDRDLVTTV